MPDLDHVLLTRFNLPSKGYESLVRARDNWLEDRVGLFERYCLPSVMAQTSRHFSWLVYVDPQSPRWLLDRLRGHELRRCFVLCLREEVATSDVLEDARRVTGGRGPRLVTTNLDNDDCLAAEFLHRIQDSAPQGGRSAVYIADGLVRRRELLYRRVDRYNAFCSVIEPWGDAVTCWADWHNLLPDRMPAVVLRGEPGWLQVVHGANVSNRVRGRRTLPTRFRDVFPGVLDDVPDPSRRQLADDLLLGVPGRAVREGCRAAGKVVLTRLAGRQGLDRIKQAWTSARPGAAVHPATDTEEGI